MKRKYILVSFPESQTIIDHPRFNECHLIDSSDGNSESDTYAIPEDLYEEIYNKHEFKVGEIFDFGLKKLKVVAKEGCKGCIFQSYCDETLEKYIGPCVSKNRQDKTPVIFVEYKD